MSKYKISWMWISIWFSIIYMMVYISSIMLKASDKFIYGMFLCSPFVIVWVVISILKDKHEPQKTFEEYFYQEEDIRRT
jgi:hypothetical protein